MSKLTYKFQKIASPLFNWPWAISGDQRDGAIYIANRGNGTLVRIPQDSSTPDQSVAVDAIRDKGYIRVAAGWADTETADRYDVPGTADTYDVMVLTPEVLYRVPVTNRNFGTAELVTGSSALTRMTDVSAVCFQDEICWFVTTANGDVVRIPENSSVADKSPLKFSGLYNCHSIAANMRMPFNTTDRVYITNSVQGSPSTTPALVASINSETAPGRRPPFVISGPSLVSPGPIGAPAYPDPVDAPFVFVGNTGSSNSLAKISHFSGELDPTPITGGGIFNPLRILCRNDPASNLNQDMFVLNGNSTITRIPGGTATPDPDPVSGGGMYECQDIAYTLSDTLFVTNPFSNSVTKITWTDSDA